MPVEIERGAAGDAQRTRGRGAEGDGVTLAELKSRGARDIRDAGVGVGKGGGGPAGVEDRGAGAEDVQVVAPHRRGEVAVAGDIVNEGRIDGRIGRTVVEDVQLPVGSGKCGT